MHLIYPPSPHQKNILKNCITIHIHIPSIRKNAIHWLWQILWHTLPYIYGRQNSLPFDWLIVSPLLKHVFYPFLLYLSMQSSKLWQQLSLHNICSWLWNSLDSCSETSLPSRLSKRHILSLISSGGKTLSVWKTLFIKINDRNTLFTHYNIHDKVCFPFNIILIHISAG